MPLIKKAAQVPYTAEQMFELVNDIDKYREFVPWCVESSVLSRDADEVRATLAFARGGLQKSFTTLNRLQPHKMIELCLVDGPFKQLEGFWGFLPHEKGCEIKLDLEFEFSSRILAMMFGPVFQQVAQMLVESFTKRAAAVYGA